MSNYSRPITMLEALAIAAEEGLPSVKVRRISTGEELTVTFGEWIEDPSEPVFRIPT